MVKVYGCSDDLVEIEGSVYKEDEIDCYNKDVRIRFDDGTVIRIGYPKRTLLGEDVGIWGIEVEKYGAVEGHLELCDNEEANPYSDIFTINAEIKSHSIIKKARR